ncbi:hypothetical protein WMW72_15695 [Paenibacillus filicis]|uniref:FAD assembly factor SdhE n=1 Tax=Paenibacillus filicis TaxID=669464 RepID=A0ABU9DKJ3_9BACL
MEFIKPRAKPSNKTELFLSDRTLAVIKYYAEYTNYSEDEVVDLFLQKILEDPDFLEWIHGKRRNTKMLKQLFPKSNIDEVDNDQTEKVSE